MKYLFSDCVFDGAAFALYRNGELVEATPQALEILHFLLISRPRLVTKDELVEEVWGGRAISDAAISVRIGALRQAIGDSGSKQALIKTVRGRGVRFVGEVEIEPATGAAAAAEPGAASAPDEPNGALANDDPANAEGPPSIAVQPLRTGDPDEDLPLIAAALPDDILTALSKLRSLRVIARASSFRYPSFATRPSRIGRDLGADYSLAGHIDIEPHSMRLVLELSATASEETIWRETYSFEENEMHDVRAEVVTQVACQIEARITAHELRRAHLQTPDHLSSWQALHLGLGSLSGRFEPHPDQAELYIAGALRDDPYYARPHAVLALAKYFRILFAETDDASKTTELCMQTATEALALDPYDPLCNLVMARAYSNLGELDPAGRHIEKAVELAPSFTLGLADLARYQVFSRQPDKARETLERASKLDPRGYFPESIELTRTLVDFMSGDFQSAAARALQLAQRQPLSTNGYIGTLVILDRTTQADAAAALAERFRQRFAPGRIKDFVTNIHFGRPELKNVILGTARKYALV